MALGNSMAEAPVTAPPASVEGISVVVAPGAVHGRPGDPGATLPMGVPGELRTVATRADSSLIGS
jgi:hypothetical protein